VGSDRPDLARAPRDFAGLLGCVGGLRQGNTSDLDQIEDEVREPCLTHGVRELAYDKRFSHQLALHLQNAGITCVDTPQGFQQTEALRKVSSAVAEARLCHGNDPVLAWMAGNTQVRTGRNGEIRVDKERSSEKVDGVSALTMAMTCVVAQPVKEPNFYESPDFDPARAWI